VAGRKFYLPPTPSPPTFLISDPNADDLYVSYPLNYFWIATLSFLSDLNLVLIAEVTGDVRFQGTGTA
jgi:hypothetical protein